MDGSTLVLLGGFSVFVGVLIGGVGIGGVLLVPVLTYIFTIDIHIAIAAAMFSYLFSGLVGATIYARKRSINWMMALWLCAGAMPAAFMGALVASAVPARGLEFLIATLIVFAGVNALLTPVEDAHGDRLLGPVQLLVIGVITGFGSAITGTGGPLVLVPMLVWLKVPTLIAVGLSQAVQLPIGSMATIGNFIYGTVDMVIGGVIAAALMIGAALGAHLAHAVSPTTLRRLVAWVLVAVGIFIVGRILLA
ncbi:MAG: sulfite exporter TauE/SafE family protein [Proteobacteria bacterium]|nr:sulfite exporter TauE/SafE family protein [Pseudomonadota bacterium]